MITGLLLAAAVHSLGPRGTVVVRGEVPEVLVVAGDVRVEGRVVGNLVVVLGDAVLEPGGRVEGDAVVLGGSLEGSGKVGGRSVVVGGRSPSGWVFSGWSLVRLGLWLVVAFFLVALGPRLVRTSGELLEEAPMRAAVGGVGFLLVWVSLVVLTGLTLRGSLALPLIALLVMVLVAIKAIGVVSLAWVLGDRLRPWLPRGLRGEIPRTGVALTCLVLVSWLPAVGMPLWIAGSVFAVGAAAFGLYARWPSWQPAAGGVGSRPSSRG